MKRTLMWTLASLAACSGSEDVAGTLHFRIQDRGDEQRCVDTDEVERVEVSVLGASTGVARPGFPVQADCNMGSVDLAIPAGRFQIDLQAVGPLPGDDQTTLFSVRSDLDWPADSGDTLVLQPQVGRLTVDVQFAEHEACPPEVENIELFLSAGTSRTDSYSRRFPCENEAFELPVLLRSRRYQIELSALSAAGFPLYDYRGAIALEPGANVLEVELEPRGHQLAFRYQLPAELDCGTARLPDVLARVLSPLGDAPVEQRFPCGGPETHVITASRFTAGRPVELSLIAEGVDRYYTSTDFIMPDDDHTVDALVLESVGNATVAWTLTEDCDALTVAVEVAIPGETEVQTETDVAMGATALLNLPYGNHQVTLVGLRAGAEVCETRGERAVRARENDWTPFEL